MSALIVNGNDHVHAVALAGQIVVCTEAGCGVDAACAGVHGDIVGKHKTACLGQEGVRSEHILVEAAVVGLKNLIAGEAADAHDLLHQSLGHDIHFVAVIGLDDGVAFVRMQGDCEVAGQSPDGGRPDDEEELGGIKMRQLAAVVVHCKFDINGGAGVVLILDLRFRERGLVMSAPVDRL